MTIAPIVQTLDVKAPQLTFLAATPAIAALMAGRAARPPGSRE